MAESSTNVLDIHEFQKMKYEDISTSKELPKVIRYKSSVLGYTKSEGNDVKDQGGDFFMDSKEYIDVRIDGLEKNINQRFQAQENLFTEKLNTINAKIDGQSAVIIGKIDSLSDNIKKDIEIITQQKIEDFQKTLDGQKKENRNFTWMVVGIAVAAATLVATVIPILF